MKKQKILLITIILLAAFLRFYKLGTYPALNADEAAIGYNAYSLLETGKDEHGISWPLHFQSFNDFKPGAYFYIVLPFVKFFGLNEWSVRLPNAILGVATVYLVYLLVKELFGKKSLEIGKLRLEILTAAMLAVSPWHIHYSRGGWEVNTATFFITLGLLLFLKSLKNPKYLLLSTLSFSLSLYTYHAARVIVPMLSLGLLIIFAKNLKENIKSLVIAGIFGLILLTPLIWDFTGGEAGSRIAGVGIFADPGPLSRINEQRGEHGDFTALIPIVLHNKLVNFGLALVENWSDHFRGDFLFLSGDIIERNKVPETGQMYLFDLVFLLVGLAFVVLRWGKNKSYNKAWLVILWWLIIAPTAAALTFQSPHALRAQNMVIPLVIISAYGLLGLLGWLKETVRQKNLLFIIYCLLFITVATCFARYQHMYWVHMSKEYPFSSQYGVKELVSYVSDNSDNFENVVVTTRYDQPYILFLFYLKYPPENFQKDHILSERDEYGFSTVGKYGKFVFKQIDWDADKLVYGRSLIIGTDEEIPPEANVVGSIYGANGYKYFEVVAN